MNVGRCDFVGAVKDEGISVYHHSPNQWSIRQGKNNSKHLSTAWDPKNHICMYDSFINHTCMYDSYINYTCMYNSYIKYTYMYRSFINHTSVVLQYPQMLMIFNRVLQINPWIFHNVEIKLATYHIKIYHKMLAK